MIEEFKVLLPHRQRWSQSAIAKLMNADRKTVKVYAEQLAVIIPDYLKDCPRNADGSILSGFQMTPYQAWVVCQLITLGRVIRSEVNGLAIHKILKTTVAKRLDLLSKASWVTCQDVTAA